MGTPAIPSVNFENEHDVKLKAGNGGNQAKLDTKWSLRALRSAGVKVSRIRFEGASGVGEVSVGEINEEDVVEQVTQLFASIETDIPPMSTITVSSAELAETEVSRRVHDALGPRVEVLETKPDRSRRQTRPVQTPTQRQKNARRAVVGDNY